MISSSLSDKCTKGDKYKFKHKNKKSLYYKFNDTSNIKCLDIPLDQSVNVALLYFSKQTYKLSLDFPITTNSSDTNLIINTNAYVLELGKNFSINNYRIFITNYNIDIESYIEKEKIYFSLSNTQHKRIENYVDLGSNISYVATDIFINKGRALITKGFDKYNYNFTNEDPLKIKQIDVYKGENQPSLFEQLSETFRKLPGEISNLMYGEEA